MATNIAQTSITIPEIDVVVDFGLERRIEYVNGVEGLYLRDISQADCLQRKGRAGRVKEGLYILASDTLFEDRVTFSVPEIQRLRIESVILKFLSIGIEIEDLDLFHQISSEKIAASKRVLETLGAIKDGKITEKGRKLVVMPLDVTHSCMLLEAEKRGVLSDMITVVSILESGPLFYKPRKVIPVQNRYSDVLDRFLVFNMLEKEYFISRNFKSSLFEEINMKTFFNIIELRKKLLKFYKDRGVNVKKEATKNEARRLDNKSVVSSGKIVLAQPRDFEVRGYIIKILSTVSVVTVDMIMEVFPNLLSVKRTEPRYNQYDGKFYVTESYWYNTICLKEIEKEIEVPDSERRVEIA